MGRFTKQIIEWYKSNRRELPWRDIADPYRIWVSEIILQQTRVNQGIDYYHRFLETFPSLEDLASAEEMEVLKLWQGLGYYSRARNMMKTAAIVMSKYNGHFPVTYDELIKLPGIGDYTAAAIASLAGNDAKPAIDGNVQRAVSRLYGITAPVNSSAMLKQAKKVLNEMIDREDPGTFNQAMIELGATLCIPSKPSCHSCPVNTICFAYNRNRVKEFPVRNTKKASSDRYFHYLVIRADAHDKVIIDQRGENDIWAKLWEFPLVESTQPRDIEDNELITKIEEMIGKGFTFISSSGWYRHKLSHLNIHARFFLIKNESGLFIKEKKSAIPVPVGSIHEYPTSRLVEQFMESFPEWFLEK